MTARGSAELNRRLRSSFSSSNVADGVAGFLSITENIDTTTPAGRMMMQMVGSFAEFERAMIRERTSPASPPPNGAKSPRASSPGESPAPSY